MKSRTDEIVSYMLAIYRDHVDGRNELDTNGLVTEAMKEVGESGDTVEFEVAARKVQAVHREER